MAGSTRAWAWHHTGFVVTDLDRALEYYETTLGFEVQFQDRAMTDLIQRTVGIPEVTCQLAQCLSPVSGELIELLQFSGVPEGTDPRMPVWPGVGHAAYLVDDVDRALHELVSAGGSPIGEVVTFPEGRAAYCFTPAGTVVELEEQPAPYGHEGWVAKG
jgi:catechol 2,3-dioxygenase-like lactoylglutathione lyase family enzyme